MSKKKLNRINDFISSLDEGMLPEGQSTFLFNATGGANNGCLNKDCPTNDGCTVNPKCTVNSTGCTINFCPSNKDCLYPNPATSCTTNPETGTCK